jgi:hypothetical protein
MALCNVPSARVAACLFSCALLTGSTLGLAQAPAAQTPSTAPPAPSTATPPAAASTPQSPVSSTTPPAVFKSTAALVIVDVLVTNGVEEIHSIPRAQFRLLEDGKEQKLIALEQHKAVDPATVQKPPSLPPNVYSNIPEAPIAGAVNVLLLDALNTPLADQSYVRRQMISYLKTIPPGTRLAIFTLASKLRVRCWRL